MRPDRLLLLTLVAVAALHPPLAQTSPARGPATSPAAASPEQQMGDYLALLQQISPAAESAARTYVAAVRLRCGQALDATGLRLAMAHDGGDPLLMGLIRAAATQDTAARHQLIAQMRCTPRGMP